MFDWRDAIRFVLYPSALIGFAAMMYGIAWAHSVIGTDARSYPAPAESTTHFKAAMFASHQ